MVWRLFRDLEVLRDQMDRMLRPGSSFARSSSDRCCPPVNIYETAEEYHVVSEMPGADKDKFDISLTAGNLTIRGEYKAYGGEGSVVRSERPSGGFNRVVTLSEQVDPNQVDGSYKNGVLTVRVAKAPEARPKQIEVKVS